MKYMKKSFAGMEVYHSTLITDGIILNANESPYQPPKKIIELFNEAIKNIEFNRYPDMDERELDQAIANHFGIDANCVTVGVGSDELLSSTFRAVLEPGEKILGFTPAFSMYKVFATLCGAIYEPVFGDENMRFDIDEMISKIKTSDAKAVVVCSPNNPTGQYFTEDEIRRLIESTDKLILLDLAYINFSDNDYTKIAMEYDNVISYRTFSKDMALPSLRVGYAISNKENIDMINCIKDPYSVTTMSQIMAKIAIENVDLYKPQLELIKSERTRVYNELKNMGFKVYPTQANFIYMNMDDKYYQELLKNKIYIRRFKEGTYRPCVGTKEENDKFLEVLRNAK